MRLARRIILCLVALVPIALLADAPIRLQDGLALDAAVPVPTMMIAQVRMPERAYANAQRVLAGADDRDGTAVIARTEAAIHAGAPALSVVPDLEKGLVAQPASARGWLLLSHIYADRDRPKAARCLAIALQLAPHNYWLAGSLARQSAALWPLLDAASQSRALDQARVLWREPTLRPQLRVLLASAGGSALVTRAYSTDPLEITFINRWLSYERSHDLQASER